MKTKHDSDNDQFTAWVLFILMAILLCMGLYMQFWPIWFFPAIYFAGICLSIFTHTVLSDSDSSAVTKQSHP